MSVESHLQMKNKNTINVTFEMLITYMEYGFYHYACHQVLEDHYLVAHALLTEKKHKIPSVQGPLVVPIQYTTRYL